MNFLSYACSENLEIITLIAQVDSSTRFLLMFSLVHILQINVIKTCSIYMDERKIDKLLIKHLNHKREYTYLLNHAIIAFGVWKNIFYAHKLIRF